MAYLADLSSGQKAVITRVSGGDGYYKQRLISEGLVPGARIKVQWVAPLGDPFIIMIEQGKHTFSLRRKEAKVLEVDVYNEPTSGK